jgi:enterochelin esterase-like enzyme
MLTNLCHRVYALLFMRLHSMRLSDGRRVTVYLPRSIRARARRRYPLLVLHDGQNLFEPERAFVPGRHWRVGEVADELIAARRIPPLVICGIDHGNAERIVDMTPTPGERREGGRAAGYVEMIVDELLPQVRREFPVSRDRADTGMGGSSLGGLVTLFAAIEHPEAFGRLLVMSPSVWWDRRVILSLMKEHPHGFADSRIWVDSGLREGTKVLADTRRLVRTLSRLKLPPWQAPPIVKHVEDPIGDHSELAWAGRLPRALMFLFGGQR